MVPNLENDQVSFSNNSNIIPLRDKNNQKQPKLPQLNNKKEDNKSINSNSKFKSILESSSILKSENSNEDIINSENDRFNKLKSRISNVGGSSSLKSFLEIEKRLNEQKSSLSSTKDIVKNENIPNDDFEEEEEIISVMSQDTASFQDENEAADYSMNSYQSNKKESSVIDNLTKPVNEFDDIIKNSLINSTNQTDIKLTNNQTKLSITLNFYNGIQ